LPLSKGHRSILSNAVFVYASLLINQVSRAIYVVVLARVLGPELYGLLAYGQAWYVALVPLSLFGLGTILVREVGRDRRNGRRVADNAAAIRVVTILFAAVVSGATGVLLNESQVISTLMLIFAVALVGRAAALWAEEMFQAYEVNRFTFRLARVFRTSEVLLGIIVALWTKDIIWVATVHALVWLAQGARGLILVFRHLQLLKPRWNWPEIRILLVACIPIGFGGFFQALMLQSGIILYRRSGAADELVGNFAIAVQALVILGSLFAALSRAALPAVSRSVARGDSRHRQYVSVMLRSAFVFGTLASVWALAIGAEITVLLLGAKYQIAGTWLWLMLLVLTPFVIKQAVSTTLVAHGDYVRSMLLSLVGIVSMVVAVLMLMPLYGFPGVIGGMLVGFSINVVVALGVIVRMRLVEHPGDIPRLVTIMTLTLLTFLLMTGYQPVLAAMVATVVLFSGVLLFGVIRETEKDAIRALLSRS